MKIMTMKFAAPILVIGILCLVALPAHSAEPLDNPCPSALTVCPSKLGCNYDEYPNLETRDISCCTGEHTDINAATMEVRDIICVYARRPTAAIALCEDGEESSIVRRVRIYYQYHSASCPDTPIIASLGSVGSVG